MEKPSFSVSTEDTTKLKNDPSAQNTYIFCTFDIQILECTPNSQSTMKEVGMISDLT